VSYYDNNPYNNPEKFGLTRVALLDDPEASYSFGYLVLWKHEDGRLFYAQDSGCSCPSPFEDFNTLEDLTPLVDTTLSWIAFKNDVGGFCYYVGRDDMIAAERTEMLQKAAALLRPLRVVEPKPGVVVDLTHTPDVLRNVIDERIRQIVKFGDQSGRPDFEWGSILMEEVGEAATEANEANFDFGKNRGDYTLLRAELVQVAAVAVAWIEAIDRRQ
jgi:hypothetical protein